VPRGDLVMRAEVGDPAVLDDQQPIGVEARRFTLTSDMPPRIVDEVEERSPDAERGHCATVSSRSDGVLRAHRRPHFQDAEKTTPTGSLPRAVCEGYHSSRSHTPMQSIVWTRLNRLLLSHLPHREA
jgi:hypothetical protein